MGFLITNGTNSHERSLIYKDETWFTYEGDFTMLSLLSSILLLIIIAPTVSFSAEQRCNQLSSNCVCSEPFQMTGFTSVNGSWLNPTDSTSLECAAEVPTAPITRSNANDMLGTTDATALNRLPLGHKVSRFLATRPGVTGTLFIGGTLNSRNLGSKYNARMSMRAYVYHSPDYNFRDETPGCHSKFLQGQVGAWHLENAFGELTMYQFTNSNWGPSSAFPRDCCYGIPTTQSPAPKSPDHAEWKGHWFFIENVVTKRAGPGVRHQLYMRDITRGVTQWNGGKEALLVDWYGTASGPNSWTTSFNQSITSSPAQVPMDLNFYRETPSGGGCNGWRGVSHLMISGWDTDSGQRIGPAVEVEGDGSVVPPPPVPAAPKNLKVN